MSPVGGERGAGWQGGGGVTVPAGMSRGAGAEILVEHLSEKHRGGPQLTPPRGCWCEQWERGSVHTQGTALGRQRRSRWGRDGKCLRTG